MAELDGGIIPQIGFQNEQDYTVYDWAKKFDSKSLTPLDFRQYWALKVPLLFSPRMGCDCLNLNFNEEASKNILFTPLEEFICNDSSPEKVFEELKKLDDPPTLCGKVFKMGEPTYSCRDCGLDPTCVLCVYCFKSSEHRSHRYKMSMSNGGGYCDCGDKEAWKTHPFCSIHIKTINTASDSDSVINRLPQDVVEKLRIVIQVALKYCHQILTWEHAISLPAELQPPDSDAVKEGGEVYSTILYNDETHTYDQVIQALTRAIACNHKQAIEYATITDREGRSIVKCSDFQTCTSVQNTISHNTSRHGSQPLKTVVMHANVVAHQVFAMRLLSWLQQIVSHSEGFRLILSNVMMEPQDNDAPLLEEVMLANTELWKTARNQWHQLFITGMLMDQQSKKTFAKVFTRNYPELMADFTADDHEHSASVTSLSVQIFTVPTLAHLLIEENAFSTLLRPFLTEAERYRNQDGKLAFERTSTNTRFRRAQYVLYDIKYLLTVTPDQWSDSMRKSFVHGFQQLLLLLSWMQGMDSVVRQVGQHVEFEAEWESGINLQFKLFPVVTLASEWCGSSQVILVKALRFALKQLVYMQQSSSTMSAQVIEIANHSASCIDYDVMSLPVTVHLPLTRLVTSLLLHMHKYNLSYDTHEFSILNKPTPEQLMELPLRCLVMVAQFRVGMWRRNGYSLLNQVYFYHNVRLREEMYDRDIQMLQIAASLIESNEFLIHLLNKFVLYGWAKISSDIARKPEDESLRPTVSLAEEFLGLILTLVSERHTPGIGKVTEADKIKKEILQLLCIESMPHSQLLKMLPKDSNQETGMEDVIGEVANFRKPQGSTTGKYELKAEFYKDFNPFFYHYSREEQSRAQEVQLKRKKQAGEEECCPPPLPIEFTPAFEILTNILQCDVMLHITKQVLRRTVDLQSPLFSETQVEKLLHLIGVALLEEERLAEQSKQGPHFFNFTSKATREGILSLLEDCMKCPRIDTQKDLLKWTLKKFRFVQSLNQVEKSEDGAASMDVQGASASQQATKDPLVDDRKKHAEMAAARRARIMAQMSNMQKNFIRKYADLFEEAGDDDGSGSLEEVKASPPVNDPIAVGNHQRGRVTKIEQHTCILCRENQEVSVQGRTLVMSSFVQHSMVLTKSRHIHQLDDAENYDPLLMPADQFCGPHTSTCGHVMHSDCWQKFYESVLLKERRRPLRYGRHVSFNVDKKEFLCPLCERLSNTVIPLVPPISTLVTNEIFKQYELGIDDWLTCARKSVEVVHVYRLKHSSHSDGKVMKMDKKEDKVYYQYKPLSEVVSGLPEDVAEQIRSLFTVYQLPMANSTMNTMPFSPSMREMMKLFSQATYTVGLGVNPHSEDDRVSLLSWWSLCYTMHSIEWLLREQGKPLFGSLSSCQDHCLSALTRCIATSNHIYDHKTIRTHSMNLLRYLLLGEYYLSNPLSAIEVDAFGVLVSLSLSMPSICTDENNSAEADALPSFGTSSPFPLGNAMDHCILKLVYTFHLVQVLLMKEFPDGTPMEVDEPSSTTSDKGESEVVLVQFYQDLITAAGVHQKKTPTGEQLFAAIREGVLPFLRCSALFYHYITDVSCPKELMADGDEYEPLCHYLSLPTTVCELFQSSLLRQLALSWARHARIHFLVNDDLMQAPMLEDPEGNDTAEPIRSLNSNVRHPIPVNQLMKLPDDYSELINSVSVFSCPNSEGDDCRSPTVCLVCGAILCSQSYCCQTELEGQNMVGACTNHAISCGSGTGMFLRVRDCKVLFLCSMTKGCYMPPPYVDAYGETDQGLSRGNPLHLCSERYKELHRLWLSHSIPEQIAHALELSTSLAATNWHLM